MLCCIVLLWLHELQTEGFGLKMHHLTIVTSIHSSTVFCSFEVCCGGNRFRTETQAFHSTAPPGESQGISRPKRDHMIPPECFGSAPGPPKSWTCPENLQREATRRHPNQMPKPPHLAPFDAQEQWLYSGWPSSSPHL